jgi:hypothetical protein
MSAWYIDLYIKIANEDRIRTIIYDKRIDFNFPIVNILFICSIIPAASVCVVYISQFVFILNVLNRGLLLTRKLLNQGLKLKSSLRRFKSNKTCPIITFLAVTKCPCHRWSRLCFVVTIPSFPRSWHYRRILNMGSTTTGATSDAEIAYLFIFRQDLGIGI